jgi:archaemetzincin
MKWCLPAFALAGFLAFGCGGRSSKVDKPPKFALHALGSVPDADIEFVKEELERTYRAEVIVWPNDHPLPEDAYYKPRNRYRADKLLDDLGTYTSSQYDRVIGVTARDISVTNGKIKDWGVFGFASADKRACVVSTFRMKANPLVRLRNVSIHEVGHTFGLDHCPNAGCVMQDAQGKGATVDGESGAFCAECEKTLGSALR